MNKVYALSSALRRNYVFLKRREKKNIVKNVLNIAYRSTEEFASLHASLITCIYVAACCNKTRRHVRACVRISCKVENSLPGKSRYRNVLVKLQLIYALVYGAHICKYALCIFYSVTAIRI